MPNTNRIAHAPHGLTELIAKRLQRHLRRAGLKIQTHFVERTLVLSGEVGSYYEKQVAQEALRHVDGIDQISNRLRVMQTDSTDL